MAIDTIINEALLKDLYSMYSELEKEVMETVAKQALKNATSTTAQDKMMELDALKKSLYKMITTPTELAKTKVAKGILSAYKAGINSAEKDTHNITTAMVDLDIPMNMQIMVLSSNNLLTNAKTQVLRNVEDKYKEIQSQASAGVLAGVDTRITATQKMLNNYAKAGITSFTDVSGRQWNLASYAEMCARTNTAHAALEGHIQRAQELGYDLMKVSRIGTTCPICAQWQGLVLSISGKTQGYKTIDEARSAGLFHPNCRHTMTSWIPELDGEGEKELNEVTPEDKSQVRNKLQERQRANERSIRFWKRRLSAAITPTDKAEALKKVHQWQAYQAKFCADNSLIRLYYREGNKVGKAELAKDYQLAKHLPKYVPGKTIAKTWKELESLSTPELEATYGGYFGSVPAGLSKSNMKIHIHAYEANGTMPTVKVAGPKVPKVKAPVVPVTVPQPTPTPVVVTPVKEKTLDEKINSLNVGDMKKYNNDIVFYKQSIDGISDDVSKDSFEHGLQQMIKQYGNASEGLSAQKALELFNAKFNSTTSVEGPVTAEEWQKMNTVEKLAGKLYSSGKEKFKETFAQYKPKLDMLYDEDTIKAWLLEMNQVELDVSSAGLTDDEFKGMLLGIKNAKLYGKAKQAEIKAINDEVYSLDASDMLNYMNQVDLKTSMIDSSGIDDYDDLKEYVKKQKEFLSGGNTGIYSKADWKIKTLALKKAVMYGEAKIAQLEQGSAKVLTLDEEVASLDVYPKQKYDDALEAKIYEVDNTYNTFEELNDAISQFEGLANMYGSLDKASGIEKAKILANMQAVEYAKAKKQKLGLDVDYELLHLSTYAKSEYDSQLASAEEDISNAMTEAEIDGMIASAKGFIAGYPPFAQANETQQAIILAGTKSIESAELKKKLLGNMQPIAKQAPAQVVKAHSSADKASAVKMYDKIANMDEDTESGYDSAMSSSLISQAPVSNVVTIDEAQQLIESAKFFTNKKGSPFKEIDDGWNLAFDQYIWELELKVIEFSKAGQKATPPSIASTTLTPAKMAKLTANEQKLLDLATLNEEISNISNNGVKIEYLIASKDSNNQKMQALNNLADADELKKALTKSIKYWSTGTSDKAKGQTLAYKKTLSGVDKKIKSLEAKKVLELHDKEYIEKAYADKVVAKQKALSPKTKAEELKTLHDIILGEAQSMSKDVLIDEYILTTEAIDELTFDKDVEKVKKKVEKNKKIQAQITTQQAKAIATKSNAVPTITNDLIAKADVPALVKEFTKGMVKLNGKEGREFNKRFTEKMVDDIIASGGFRVEDEFRHFKDALKKDKPDLSKLHSELRSALTMLRNNPDLDYLYAAFDYTYGSGPYNNYLRGINRHQSTQHPGTGSTEPSDEYTYGQKWAPKFKKFFDNVAPITETVYLKRLADENAVAGILGLSKNTSQYDAMKALEGAAKYPGQTVFSDKGFMSAGTYVEAAWSGNVAFSIKANIGTKLLYGESFSNYQQGSELEMLLNADQKMRLITVLKRGDPGFGQALLDMGYGSGKDYLVICETIP